MSPQNRERVWFPSGTSAMAEERDIRGIILWFSDKKKKREKTGNNYGGRDWKKSVRFVRVKKVEFKNVATKVFFDRTEDKEQSLVNGERKRNSKGKWLKSYRGRVKFFRYPLSFQLYPTLSPLLPPLLLPSFNFPVTGNKRSPDN